MKKKSYFILPFINLLIATILGAFLRFVHVVQVPGINFKYVLHAHSHVAFLGWVYMGLFLLLVNKLVPEDRRNRKAYSRLYWLNQFSVIGMLLSFPAQGYALFSIVFSTLHILLSYFFAVAVWKDTTTLKAKPILYFLRASLIFMIISSAGPWALAVIMAKGMAGSDLYELAIYFYLHFQYNGWFTFALIALLLEFTGNPLPEKEGKLFFRLLAVATVPAYAGSVLFVQASFYASFVSFLASSLELFAFGYLVKLFFIHSKETAILRGLTGVFIKIAVACLFLKTAIQIGASFVTAFHIRHFLIGYLHLVLLGFVSIMLLTMLIHFGKVDQTKVNVKFGMYLYLVGFVMTESLIFLQGIMAWTDHGIIPGYFLFLFVSSLTIPSGVLLLLFSAAEAKSRPKDERRSVSTQSIKDLMPG